MRELRRVLSQARLLGLVALLLVLSAWFYLQSQSPDGRLDSAWTEARAYRGLLAEARTQDDASARAWLEAQQANARTLLSLHILSGDEIGDQNYREMRLAELRRTVPELVAEAERGQFALSPAECEVLLRQTEQLLAQYEHLEGWPARLEMIRQNARRLTGVSLFAVEGFAKRNIERTVADFARLDDVVLRIGPDRALTSLVASPFTELAILAALLAVVLSFVAERRRGLWLLVYASPYGRLRLGLQRVAILAGSAFAIVGAVYGLLLLLARILYGPLELTRALQSHPAYAGVTHPLTAGQALAIYLVLRALSALALALLAWFILAAIERLQLALVALTFVLSSQWLIHTLTRDAEKLVLLRYLNVFALVDLHGTLTHYLNLNLFGAPLAAWKLSLGLRAATVVLAGTACVAIQARRHPLTRQNALLRVADRAQRRLSAALAGSRLAWIEARKVLWSQRGLLLLAVLVVLQLRAMAPPPRPIASYDAPLDAARTRFAGLVDEAKRAEIADERAALEASIAARPAGYEAGPMGDFEAQQLAVWQQLEHEIARIDALAAELGREPRLVAEAPYQALFAENEMNYGYATALRLLIFAVLILARVISYERESGVERLNRASPGGRGRLWSVKLGLTLLLLTVLWLLVYGSELWRASAHYGPLQTLDAPLGYLSLHPLRYAHWPIGAYLALLYDIRLLLLYAVGGGILLLSSVARRAETAIAGNVALWLLPATLAFAGIAQLRPLALVEPLAATAMLAQRPWLYLPLLLLGALGYVFSWRRLTRGSGI